MSESAPTLSGWESWERESHYQDRSLSYLEPCPSHSSYQYSEREAGLQLGPEAGHHFLAERDHRYLPSRQAERSRVRGVWEESGSHHPHHLDHLDHLQHPHHLHHLHHLHHASSPNLQLQPLLPPVRHSRLSPYSDYHDYHGSFPELNQHQISQSHRY